MEYKLTRWLYAADEVDCSLMLALVGQSDIRECYYWIYELHYSGLPAFDSLWKIFYDFYLEKNPKLEGYMRRKAAAFRDGDEKVLADIVRNMHRLKSSPTTFLLRQRSIANLPATKVYRGRRPAWCKDYNDKVVLLLRSIDKLHWENIAYYVSKIVDALGSESVFRELVRYFARARGLEIDDKIYDYWSERSHPDDKHYLMALIVHLCAEEESLNLRNIYIRSTKTDHDWIKGIETNPAPLSKYGHTQLYNMLPMKRLYGTARTLGAFQLGRDKFDNLPREIWYHWEYHARNTPLWKTRFDAHQAAFKDKDIVFPDDDKLEEFYELYGYEPDEQSHETQSLGIGPIEDCTWESWVQGLFDVEIDIRFPEGHRYLY